MRRPPREIVPPRYRRQPSPKINVVFMRCRVRRHNSASSISRRPGCAKMNREIRTHTHTHTDKTSQKLSQCFAFRETARVDRLQIQLAKATRNRLSAASRRWRRRDQTTEEPDYFGFFFADDACGFAVRRLHSVPRRHRPNRPKVCAAGSVANAITISLAARTLTHTHTHDRHCFHYSLYL
jgi:hypothetical protein